MVVKKAAPQKAPAAAAKSRAQQYDFSDVEGLEKDALEKANKALSAIENAIAVWDASKDKPVDYKPRIERLRYFHDALANWEKKMLLAMAKKEDMNSRVEILREFSDICYNYAK